MPVLVIVVVVVVVMMTMLLTAVYVDLVSVYFIAASAIARHRNALPRLKFDAARIDDGTVMQKNLSAVFEANIGAVYRRDHTLIAATTVIVASIAPVAIVVISVVVIVLRRSNRRKACRGKRDLTLRMF